MMEKIRENLTLVFSAKY